MSLNRLLTTGTKTSILTGWLIAGTALGDTLQGQVFDDVNGNGLLDEAEPLIAQVRVSNGRDVVLTDSNGRYEITVNGDTEIFITQPAGYGVPLNEANLPQFYYIHRPNGSPSHFRYPGVEPTGDLPESVNFPLRRTEVESKFEAILFADPQPQTEVELEYIRDDVISELIHTSARFGMTAGDIMFDDLALFERYNRLVSTIGIPWYNIPGNHELNFEAETDAKSLETFTRHFGPSYYAFEYGNVVFFVLDNVVYEGMVPTEESPEGRSTYHGGIDEAQLEWIRNELQHVSTEKLIFLAMHVPLNSPSGQAPGIHTANGGELLSLLEDYPHVYSVSGHMHAGQHVYLNEQNEVSEDGRFHHHVLSTVSGSWWSGPMDERGIPTAIQSDGTPNGYHILSVDGVEHSVRFKGAGEDPKYQMRITLDTSFHSGNINGLRDFRTGELFDGRLSEAHVASTRVLVNLFDGGPRSKVEFHIDDGEHIQMVKVVEPDPHFIELIARFQTSMKSWLTPYESQHLWAAKLPDLSQGTYVLHVEATDDFGNKHKGHKVLEITSH